MLCTGEIYMNPFAYRSTGFAIKTLSNLSKTRVRVHGEDNIPAKGAIIYAINHFTRIETLFIPYHINKLTKQVIWSLADYELFKGGLGNYLSKVGALSTRDPDRDLLIVKSLLTGEASWIIFPEGRMVKSKKIYKSARQTKGEFIVASPDGERPPHTGTATLALRTEFYRERIRRMMEKFPEEAERIIKLYQIQDVTPVLEIDTYIVPVNLTYYPIRARENILSKMAEWLIEDLSGRMLEEIMTEGTMLLSGVDVDMWFGEPIRVGQYMKSATIQQDINDPKSINFDDPIFSRRMMWASAIKIMERYMSNIYDMTTINHDHIFASLLKHIPGKDITEQDFRRRAYLSTTFKLDKLKSNLHEGLLNNQINILTDDRYEKYKNFLTLAIEKGVVKKEKQFLKKESFFSDSSDFHRVRIENPLSVITNEVEPLTWFQDKIKSLAQQPALRVKYWLRNHLIQKALYDFERDYIRFSVEGETKDRDVGKPFFLKGKTKTIGIVLVHGYMAAPLEVRGLAEYLSNHGYYVYAPRLTGHGTSPDDLAMRNHMEWVEAVEEAFVIMRNTCRKVVMGGFSTGAGLALDLCTRVDDIAGVFAISPPFALQDFSARFIPAVNLWNKLMSKMSFESAKKEFVENLPENPHINYKRNPVSGVIELERLMSSVESRLSKVSVPALVVQSLKDPVVSHKGAMKIFELLASKDKELLMVNFERHGIINHENSERVYKAVGDFLEKLRY